MWNAIPRLRKLLVEGRCLWGMVKKEAWRRLVWALFGVSPSLMISRGVDCGWVEPDVLRFPLHVLSAAAMVDSVVDVLLEGEDGGGSEEVERSVRRGVRTAVDEIVLDVQRVFGIEPVRLSSIFYLKVEG
jgi:hypothetical protein